MVDTNIEISIVIVTWNAKKYMRDCLKSLEDQDTGVPTEIIVVDNASTDGTADLIRSEFPNIKLVENEKNLQEIVKDVIEENMRKKHVNVNSFSQSATYKPSKQNISINNFAGRIIDNNIMIEPGERFDYLVIRHPNKNAKKHEKMILLNRFDDATMKLDMKYYFQSLISVCARFVNYHEDYQVQEDEYKMRDEKSQKNAENYLKNFINRVDDNMNGDITRYLVSKKRKIEEMQTKSDSVKRQKIKHQQLKRKRDEDDERQTKISRYFVNTVTKNK